jgi:hypothetical protein
MRATAAATALGPTGFSSCRAVDKIPLFAHVGDYATGTVMRR